MVLFGHTECRYFNASLFVQCVFECVILYNNCCYLVVSIFYIILKYIQNPMIKIACPCCSTTAWCVQLFLIQCTVDIEICVIRAFWPVFLRAVMKWTFQYFQALIFHLSKNEFWFIWSFIVRILLWRFR